MHAVMPSSICSKGSALQCIFICHCITLVLLVLFVEKCSYDGQLRLARKIENLPLEGVGGVIEICVNGTFTRVCANNSFSLVDTETLGRLTCSQLGYSSEGRVVVYQRSSLFVEYTLYYY